MVLIVCYETSKNLDILMDNPRVPIRFIKYLKGYTLSISNIQKHSAAFSQSNIPTLLCSPWEKKIDVKRHLKVRSPQSEVHKCVSIL